MQNPNMSGTNKEFPSNMFYANPVKIKVMSRQKLAGKRILIMKKLTNPLKSKGTVILVKWTNQHFSLK